MAKDLRLDVVTSSDGKGLLEAAAETERLAKEVDKLGEKLRDTGIDADVAGRGVDDFDDKVRKAARESGRLTIELEATKEQLKSLGRQFDETGDRALLKQISSTRRYSGQLKQLAKDMEDAGKEAAKEAEQIGADVGKEAESGLASAFSDSSVGPFSGPVLLGVLASPGTYGIAAMAGEMIGGAILTGIGLAGIGSGIALEINDPEVQSAIGRLKSDVSNGLTDAASSFIGPLSHAVDGIDAEFTKLEPGIKSVFDQIAPEVDALGKGAGGFLDELVPAFGQAIVAAKPLLDMLAADLPDLGRTFAHLFDTISANAGVAELGLQDIVFGVEALINLVSAGINIVSDMARDLNDLELAAAEGAKSIVDLMIKVADAAHLPDQGLKNLDVELGHAVDQLKANKEMADGVTGSMGQLGTAADTTATGVNRLDTEMQNFNTTMGVMDHLLNRTEALNSLTIGMAQFVDQLKKSKDAFDSSSEAGAKNQNAYIGLIKQAEQYRQTLIDSGVTEAVADKMFDDMVKKIDAAALAAGLSAKQIEALNKQLGITAATKPIDIPINVHTSYTYSGQKPRPGISGSIPFLASGGHFDPGPIVVGEHGPELLVPDSAGTIIPALNPGGGGRAPAAVMSGPTVVQLEARPGDAMAEFLLSQLRGVIAGRYGGDVIAALAGNRN